mgnify:CR=1 FL=1
MANTASAHIAGGSVTPQATEREVAANGVALRQSYPKSKFPGQGLMAQHVELVPASKRQ